MENDQSNIRYLFGSPDALHDAVQAVSRLKGGGGGGTSGGMEERVNRLEKHLDQMTRDVGELRVNVATLTENVRHLPTKPWLFTTLSGLLLAAIAVIGLLIRFLPPAVR